MKKLLSLFLIFAFVFSLVSCSEIGKMPIDEEFTTENNSYDPNRRRRENEDFRYRVFNNSSVIIMKYIGDKKDVTIPMELDGYPVTSIDFQAFFMNNEIESVVIADSISSIGSSAFSRCENLKTVTLSSSLFSTGYNTFQDCISLESVIFKEGIELIGDYAFFGCEKLVDFKLPDGILALNTYSLGNCKSLQELIIPDSVTAIGRLALIGCDNLKYIKFPRNMTGVNYNENYLFADTGLKDITMPENLTVIEPDDLYLFENLENIFVSDSNTAYTSVRGVLYDKSIKNLIVYPNENKSTRYDIPEKVENISKYAFSGNQWLRAIYIPKSVTDIGESAFSSSDKLTVFVYKDSYAHKYAQENKINFIII